MAQSLPVVYSACCEGEECDEEYAVQVNCHERHCVEIWRRGFFLLASCDSMRKDRGGVAQVVHDGVAGVCGLRYECMELIVEKRNN